MEHRPIITYSGDIEVFQSVAPSLQRGIGSEAVEWKRAYGRSTKHVHLHPRFIPLPSEQNNTPDGTVDENKGGTSSENSSILNQPMLHTFWTDCSDVELYRSSTKETIQSWLSSLKSFPITEWLIVLVEPPDNKKTKQLLPRSSVLDRLKTDFAQKQTERCLSIPDPNKIDSKSMEALHTMLHRVRVLLLGSYSKTLGKFEENMRGQREKRNESGWNFCNYFLLQEELAFVLEMLEVYDEALVQYDELDALFTQFVLNSHLTDTPQWLLSFQRYGDEWPSLSLNNSSFLNGTRERIKNSTVSLINFRNYLFARQASLLLKQKQGSELAARSLPFLHNCLNELSILDVMFTEEGATAAWIFASCLEILGTICGHGQGSPINPSIKLHESGLMSNGTTVSSNDNFLDFSLHSASLWDYAREKLYELGKLCDLLPQSTPKGDQLHKVLSLAGGLVGIEDSSSPNSPSNNKSNNVPPIQKLKNALSTKEQFQTTYLELCELAMGSYKHIGRLRSARKVGLSLANYYIEGNEDQKAIGFLTDALKTFREDKWDFLVLQTLLKLSDCYRKNNEIQRYVGTCGELACAKELSLEKRIYYFQEMLQSIRTGLQKGEPIITSSSPCFSFNSIQIITQGQINLGSCPLSIHLTLSSHFPSPLPSTSLKISILPFENHAKNPPPSPLSTPKSGGRKSSSSSVEFKKVEIKRKESESLSLVSCEEEDLSFNESFNEEGQSSLRLELGQIFDTKQDRTIQGGKITCANSHQALRRKDSQAKSSERKVTKSDFSLCASSAQNIEILPGNNTLSLDANVSESGEFRLGQISVLLNNYEFISPPMGCRYTFKVDKIPGKISLFNENLPLLAGIEQNITLSIFTGSNQINDDMVLNIRTSLGLQTKFSIDSPFVSDLAIPLQLTKPFSTTQVRLKVKADLGPQKDNSIIEHKLIVKFPWCNDEMKIGLNFSPPLMSSHKIQTTKGGRKFIQILLHGLSDSNFITSNHELRVQGSFANSIPLVPLNHRSQQLILSKGLTASYIFEIGTNELGEDDEESQIRLEFATTFSLEDGSEPPELYKYYFSLQKFKTQYEIKYRVESHKGIEFCRVGNMCSMFIEIIRIKKDKTSSSSSSENSIMYEIRADQHMWAICGRSSGVISLDVGGNETQTHQVTLDVMPMTPGFLPLPTVYLSKYIIPDHKGSHSNVPKLEPFQTGQVFNGCKGLQMHILPVSSSQSSIVTKTNTSGSTSLNDTHF